MATLLATASGNLTSSSTWKTVDTTSLLNSEAGNTASTTSYVYSSTFTPGAITVDGIAVKLASKTSGGTISIELYNNTGAASVKTVTANIADLASAGNGWHFFKFDASTLLLAATAYKIGFKTSSTGTATLYRDGTAGNWSRLLRTTTTAAPAAGDAMHICGEITGAGSVTALTVTMDSTATTAYGNAGTTDATASFTINNGGTLTYGTAAATNYVLRLTGIMRIYGGGVVSIGTTGTPIPRDSSAVLEFDCSSTDGKYYIYVDNGGTLNAQGLSRTSGKNIDRCYLNGDEAAAQTVLSVNTDTGWLNGDEIAIAPTTRTPTEAEQRTLSGGAGATTITVSSGLTNAHSGTSPTQAEVILLSRNVKIRSLSATYRTYIKTNTSATIDLDWVEMRYVGLTSSGAIIFTTATGGEVRCNNCSFWDGNMLFSCSTASANNFHIVDCVVYNFVSLGTINATTSSWTFDNIWIIRVTTTSTGWTFSGEGGTITDIIVCGASSTGSSTVGSVLFSDTRPIGTRSGITVHSSSSGIVFYISGTVGKLGDYYSVNSWRNGYSGIEMSGASIVIDGGLVFGNTTANIRTNSSYNFKLKNLTVSGDTSFSTTNGIVVDGIAANCRIEKSTFGVASGIYTTHTTDVSWTVSTIYLQSLYLIDCVLASSTELTSTTGASSNLGMIYHHNKDQVAGVHKVSGTYQTIESDSTVYNTAAPSMKITPGHASIKSQSATPDVRGMVAPVSSGATCIASVYVRKDASYNGNQPRLMVRSCGAAGITSDTVLDTMSVGTGSWEQLSGTTSAVSGNCVLEFYVDCDGTAGYINVDDWEIDGNTNNLANWIDGMPVSLVGSSGGSSGGVKLPRTFSGF